MKHKVCIVLFLAVFIAVALVSCGGPKTLAEITKGSADLRYRADFYTVYYLNFYGETNYDGGEETNCCKVRVNYYKDAPWSPSGKIIDDWDEYTVPCKISEHMLTLNYFDMYYYNVETIGDDEYVVFSKPLLGTTKWEIDH